MKEKDTPYSLNATSSYSSEKCTNLKQDTFSHFFYLTVIIRVCLMTNTIEKQITLINDALCIQSKLLRTGVSDFAKVAINLLLNCKYHSHKKNGKLSLILS